MNQESQREIKEIILENQKLLIENNALLKKMHRSAVRHLWFNIAWIVLFFVLPLIALYKIAVPFYSSYSSAPEGMQGQLNELNELRSLLEQ
jgi:hypothetical protein